MSIQLVIFGVLGTCVEGSGVLDGALREALAEAGVRAPDASLAGVATPHAIRLRLQEAADDPALVAAADVDRVHARFVRAALDRIDARPPREALGASQAFARLRARHVRVALVTGLTTSLVDALDARLGWTRGGNVEAIVSSDEVACGVPFPDAVHAAMQRCGVRDPARVACVFAHPLELRAAAAAGAGLVVAVAPNAAADELRRAPHAHRIPTMALVPELLRRIDVRAASPVAWGWSV